MRSWAKELLSWADLQEELLNLILSKLFAKDRHHFGLVCKSWSAAAAVSPYRHSPCLMSYDKGNDKWKILQYNGTVFMKFPQLHYNTEILCSDHGWLLISHDRYYLSFFDPFNNRSIKIPPFLDVPYKRIIFCNPPTSSNCTIVGIANTLIFEPVYSPGMDIGILKLGEGKWKSHEYICRTQFNLSACNPVLHRGLILYCMDVKGNIGTFDINKPGDPSSWVVYNKCLSSARFRNNTKQHFLIKHHEEEENEEKLLAVFLAYDEKKVSLFRLLEPEMKWEPVDDIGDKRLFVSGTSSCVETAPMRSMANRIYFPRLHGEDGVYYSLNTRKYHSYEDDFSSKNSYKLKELTFATWIIPSATPKSHEELTWHSKLS